MEARYFRHLFQNEKDSVIQLGCIWDKAFDIQTNYMITGSSYSQNTGECNLSRPDREDRKRDSIFEANSPIDIAIVTTYTFIQIVRLLKMVEEHPIKDLFLPYFTPIERLCLAHEMSNQYLFRKQVMHFLEDPYQALLDAGAQNVYFVHGNGTPLPVDLNHLENGRHFEEEECEIQKIIENMEGRKIPVVKGGYYKVNNWLFYLGVFGPDIREIHKFMDESFDGDGIYQDTDYRIIDKLVKKYEKRFGYQNYSSIAVFHGPLNAEPKTHNFLMIGKSFTREMGCHPVISKDGDTCALKCQYESDYDYLQRYKHNSESLAKMGIWMLGNINLKRYLPDALAYFWNILPGIRCVCPPNCGEKEFWNSKILQNLKGNDNTYWAIPIEPGSRVETTLEIVTYQAHNRLIQLNQEIGYCFSGYIMEKEQKEKKKKL